MTKENVVIYQGENGEICVDARLENDTIWLTQKAMAEVFGVNVPAISKHLKHIFEEKEVVSEMEITTKHGAMSNRTQTQSARFYNLDAIISVGYRVKSKITLGFAQIAFSFSLKISKFS